MAQFNCPLDAQLTSLASARRVTRHVLRASVPRPPAGSPDEPRASIDRLVANVELVVTELVTNAIQHGEPPISLTIDVAEDVLCLSVSDTDVSTEPRLRRPGEHSTGGRGLLIVDRLCARWGTTNTGTDKWVWAELRW